MSVYNLIVYVKYQIRFQKTDTEFHFIILTVQKIIHPIIIAILLSVMPMITLE